jgi:hypothetical protein
MFTIIHLKSLLTIWDFFRMGVKEMAFGIGVINMKGSEPPEMHYTNLWLPSR